MTEQNENLESRLSSLRPRSIDSSLEDRIVRASARPAPTRAAVSLFWTAVTGGAIAASTILVLLMTQGAHPAQSGPSVAVMSPQRSPASLAALASADWRWGDDLYLDESRRLP